MSLNRNDRQILSELIAMANREPGLGLTPFQSVASAHQYRQLYAVWRRYVHTGASVLDWGVGNGHFSYYLVCKGYRVTGFSLEDCPLEARLDTEQYRLTSGAPNEPVTLPFPNRSFDAVASVGVLEHVRETGGSELASLQEIQRILRPGGRLLCYHLPNRYSLIEYLARRMPHKYHHPYRFTRRDIHNLLDEAELELLTTCRYGFLPRNIWGGMPAWLKDSTLAAGGWDAVDDGLGFIFNLICQNHLFVAQRRLEG